MFQTNPAKVFQKLMAPLYAYSMEIECSYWSLGSITQSLFSGTGPRKRRKSSLVGWPHEKTYYEKLHGQLIPILYFADPVLWPSKWFNDQGLISVSNYISPKMWLKMCRLQLTWTFLTGEFFNVSALLGSKDLAKWQIDFAEGTNSALKQVLLYK